MTIETRGRGWRGLVPAVGAVVLLAGCGSGGGAAHTGTVSTHAVAHASATPSATLGASASHSPTASTPAPLSSAAAAGLTKGMVLPLEKYMESYQDEITISRAVNTKAAACMAGFGIDYHPPKPVRQPLPTQDDSNLRRRYGVASLAVAKRYGYGLPDPASPTPGPTLSTTERQLLAGTTTPGPHAADHPLRHYHGKAVPRGGCIGLARRKLGADFSTTLTGDLDGRSFVRSKAEPKVKAAVRRWSACMKSKGYGYTSPQQAGASAGTGATQVAVDDVRCKKKSHLVRDWFDADAAIQRTEVSKHRAALDRQRARIKTAVRRATTINEGH